MHWLVLIAATTFFLSTCSLYPYILYIICCMCFFPARNQHEPQTNVIYVLWYICVCDDDDEMFHVLYYFAIWYIHCVEGELVHTFFFKTCEESTWTTFCSPSLCLYIKYEYFSYFLYFLYFLYFSHFQHKIHPFSLQEI